ncbi:MAG: NAD-dependent epimerase/dehydratase family protein [Bacteroidales bacterium]|nr:NAD-dependent epimerase/dehydratase family protein [Bacteroidales bacterium]MCK4406449.1 NAD-dependent epimerase/dehydratase family protein [Bacteroidales bacterium]
MKKILIIGSVGQIGSELTLELRKIYGNDNVVATGRKTKPSEKLLNSGPFEFFDTTGKEKLIEICKKYKIDAIVNMAAILSATGEEKPMLAWHVNMNGLISVLEVAREMNMEQVLVPSSIAVFGPETPVDNTPQETILRPTTMYGVTKVAGELLGDYYVRRFGLDVRGLRYPGIISNETLPGGGTTDYAVAIYYEAIKHKKYTCFVKEDTRLPMMYMPDCLKATIDLMQADFSKLKHHSDFNVGAMSFSVGELADSIKKYIPDFEIKYEPDFRQAIADSWPNSVDDSAAREEWGWKPSYDLDSMTQDMLKVIGEKHKKGLI